MISNTQITAQPEYDIQFWNAMRNKEAREDILAKGRDTDDVEMLEDLLVAAVNEALEKVDAETTSAMSKFTGGMGGGMPGLF